MKRLILIRHSKSSWKDLSLTNFFGSNSANHVDLALKNEIDILWIGARTTVSPFIVQEIAEALRGTRKVNALKINYTTRIGDVSFDKSSINK